MNRFNHRQMADLSPEKQAAKAIAHVIGRMRADDRIYHLMGEGSQSFDLLTEAHAALSGQDLVAVRESLTAPKEHP